MKTFIVLTAVVAATSAFSLSKVPVLQEIKSLPELLQQWKRFMFAFGKKYANEAEEKMRMEIFTKHLREFAEHNKKYDAGLVSYKKGATQFMDLTPEEFRRTLTLMYQPEMSEQENPSSPNGTVPDFIDWREKGAVTPVKNQGQCGSCYAFSAAGALEGQLFKKTGTLVDLSKQNLIDCSQKYNNKGCNGGLPSNCFKYIKDNGGIVAEESYPYETKVGECRYDSQNSAGMNDGFVSIAKGDENALKAALGTVGPISVGINANLLAHYEEGVFDEENCDSTPNHAVVAVGYGSEDGKDYWIIKNSWGEGWGEDGYVRMSRNKNNQCGIASIATYPTL